MLLFVFQMVLTLINGIFGFLALTLGFRVVLKLFAASTTAPFVDWIYQVTSPFLAPFTGIFPSPSIAGGYLLELPTVFALLVYTFLGFLVSEVIRQIEIYLIKVKKAQKVKEKE